MVHPNRSSFDLAHPSAVSCVKWLLCCLLSSMLCRNCTRAKRLVTHCHYRSTILTVGSQYWTASSFRKSLWMLGILHYACFLFVTWIMLSLPHLSYRSTWLIKTRIARPSSSSFLCGWVLPGRLRTGRAYRSLKLQITNSIRRPTCASVACVSHIPIINHIIVLFYRIMAFSRSISSSCPWRGSRFALHLL